MMSNLAKNPFDGYVDPTLWFPEDRHDFEVPEPLIPNMCVCVWHVDFNGMASASPESLAPKKVQRAVRAAVG